MTIGLILVPAAGGSLSRLSDVELPYPVVTAALFVLQSLMRGLPSDSASAGGVVVLWAFCCVGLLCVLWLGRERRGMVLMGMGIGCNMLVVLFNSSMPVAVESYAIASGSPFYQALSSASVLPWLSDVLPFSDGMVSLGDLLLATGVLIFMLAASCTEESPDRWRRDA